MATSTPTGAQTAQSVRLNVNLNTATAETLKKLSEELGVSFTEVVRRSISLYEFLDSERRSGHRVQISDPIANETRELVLM